MFKRKILIYEKLLSDKLLDVFTEKFSDRILQRYLIYTKDMDKDKDIFCIPCYMVPFL